MGWRVESDRSDEFMDDDGGRGLINWASALLLQRSSARLSEPRSQDRSRLRDAGQTRKVQRPCYTKKGLASRDVQKREYCALPHCCTSVLETNVPMHQCTNAPITIRLYRRLLPTSTGSLLLLS